MPTELIAQGCQQFVGKWVFFSRPQPSLQRERDHRSRYVEVDRLKYRPTPFAGIGHPGLNLFQFPVVHKRTGGQVQQPGTHHAAIAPDLSNVIKIEVKFTLGFQDLETFSIRLHQAILDAIVNHLNEMPRAARSNVSPAPILSWRESLENRAVALDHFFVPAD